MVQSTLNISNTDISKYPLISKYTVQISYFNYFLNSCYLKLLISRNKFSGTRKFNLGDQVFGLSFDFEVNCIHIKANQL